jgi:hypothetical protein
MPFAFPKEWDTPVLVHRWYTDMFATKALVALSLPRVTL